MKKHYVALYQRKVQLFLVEVSTRHLNTHGITEGVAVVVTASDKLIITLVELVVIIIKVAQRYHSLTFCFVEFHIETKLRDARDDAIELLTEAVTMNSTCLYLMLARSARAAVCSMSELCSHSASYFSWLAERPPSA